MKLACKVLELCEGVPQDEALCTDGWLKTSLCRESTQGDELSEEQSKTCDYCTIDNGKRHAWTTQLIIPLSLHIMRSLSLVWVLKLRCRTRVGQRSSSHHIPQTLA